jgi:hypothetical protein
MKGAHDKTKSLRENAEQFKFLQAMQKLAPSRRRITLHDRAMIISAIDEKPHAHTNSITSSHTGHGNDRMTTPGTAEAASSLEHHHHQHGRENNEPKRSITTTAPLTLDRNSMFCKVVLNLWIHWKEFHGFRKWHEVTEGENKRLKTLYEHNLRAQTRRILVAKLERERQEESYDSNSVMTTTARHRSHRVDHQSRRPQLIQDKDDIGHLVDWAVHIQTKTFEVRQRRISYIIDRF